MLVVSRVLPITRRLLSNSSIKINICTKSGQPVRHGGTWAYRSYLKEPNYYTRKDNFFGGVVMTCLWYTILYHLWYDWGLLVPSHVRPDPSKWTDEELGIPPDDED